MTNQPESNQQHLLLNALLDLLIPEGETAVEESIRSFRELLKALDIYTSFRLLRLKMKAMVNMRDEALLARSSQSKNEGLEPSIREPVNHLLEHALSLLENASSSTTDYYYNLDKAIGELRRAKDMVNLQQLSKQLLESGSSMADATSQFRNDIGEIAHAMLEYQRKINTLENEVIVQKKAASVDKLTSLLNRAAFDRDFQDAFESATRFHTPLSMLLIDIDHFKDINDTHGHQVGDDVLVSFATLLKKSLAPVEKIYRYGGDEFAVLFVNQGLVQAEPSTLRIRDFVEEHDYRYEKVRFKMSVSGGLTQMKEDETRGDFFKRADSMLYRAKDQGRDRICVG